MSVQVPLFEKGDKKASKVAAKVEEIVGEGFDVAKFVENFEVLVEAAGGVAEVRRLVLSLAVRGAFTNAECFGSEVGNSHPFRLPKGWAWQRLADCAQVSDGPFGSKLKSSHYVQEPGFRVVRLGNIGIREFKDDDRSFVTKDHFRSLAVNHLERGDIVVASLGNPPGRACLVPDGALPAIHKADCFRVRICAEGIEPAFLVNVLNSDFALSRATELHRGDTRGRITLSHLRDTPMPLPPLAEQKRIVAKVDQLMSLCDDLEAKQTKKRETGTRLTKSALDALTSADGPDEFDAAWKRVVENFDVLIDRAEKVGELRLTIMDVASHGRLVRQHENDPPATVAIATKRREIERCVGTVEVPDDRGALPPGWTWELLGNLGADAENPIQTGPFGAQLHRSDFVSEGVPVIAVGNLTGTGFTTDGLYFVTRTKAESLSRYDIHAGDLLFARSGATTGKVCVAPHFVKDWRMTGHILRVRLDPHLILPELVVYWLWGSAVVRSQIMGNIRGGTRPGYNTSLLKSIVVPVPPLAEQGRILAKIAHLMEVCDQLEERLRSVEDRASKLVEAVVRELVA